MKSSNDVRPTSVMSRMFDDCVGDAVAITSDSGCVSFDELADAVHFVADRLGSAGVTSSARVGLLHAEGVPAVVAIAAVASLGATIVLVDAAEHHDVIADKLMATGPHFVMADAAVEHLLDELAGDAIPAVIAEEYSLVRVECGAASFRSEVVYTDGAGTSPRSWVEVFDDAARMGRAAGLDAHSTVTVSESLSNPSSLTTLFASLLAGATVSMYEPVEAADAPCSVAARLYADNVTVLAGSASYVESLVRSGVVGLLPISSLTDIVVVGGRMGEVFHGVLAAAMPSVRVTRSPEASLVCA